MKFFSALPILAAANDQFFGDKVIFSKQSINNLWLNNFFAFQVFRIRDVTERIAGVLERASAGEDTWKLPKFDGDYMDVAVKSENLDAFKSILDRANVHYETMIEDLGIAIQENLKSVQPAYTSLEDYDYGKYGTFEDYQAWQRDFVEANSDMITLSSYGTSFEGRDLNVMKIGSGSKVG